MQAGSTITYTATGTVAATATGNLVNTATVTSASDTSTGNNSATDTDTLLVQADLSISKNDGKTSVVAGTTDTYFENFDIPDGSTVPWPSSGWTTRSRFTVAPSPWSRGPSKWPTISPTPCR